VEALRGQRLTLELKCADLDAEAMARRSVEPSTLSLLGLVRHLAGGERETFRIMGMRWFRNQSPSSRDSNHSSVSGVWSVKEGPEAVKGLAGAQNSRTCGPIRADMSTMKSSRAMLVVVGRCNRYPPTACRTPMLRFVTRAIVDDTNTSAFHSESLPNGLSVCGNAYPVRLCTGHRAAYRSTLFPSGSFTEA
jgi:hypothetical protein